MNGDKTLLIVSLSLFLLIACLFVIILKDKRNRKRLLMVLRQMKLMLVSVLTMSLILSLVFGIIIGAWCVYCIIAVTVLVIGESFIFQNIINAKRTKLEVTNKDETKS